MKERKEREKKRESIMMAVVFVPVVLLLAKEYLAVSSSSAFALLGGGAWMAGLYTPENLSPTNAPYSFSCNKIDVTLFRQRPSCPFLVLVR